MGDIVLLGKAVQHAPAFSTAMFDDIMRQPEDALPQHTLGLALHEGTHMALEADAGAGLRAGDVLAFAVVARLVDAVDVFRQPSRSVALGEFARGTAAAVDPQGEDGGEHCGEYGESGGWKMHPEGL